MSLRTPLGRARGWGSARDGTGHFRWQRLSAIINLIGVVFLAYTAVSLAGASHADVRSYFQAPLPGALMLWLIFSACFHMALGMQVIVEDYVQAAGTRALLLTLNIIFATFIALASALAVLKLSLGV
jgi:succinate dehydrogenase / fumarate reductase membrane anchor subunit